jgi:hypothetical protein
MKILSDSKRLLRLIISESETFNPKLFPSCGFVSSFRAQLEIWHFLETIIAENSDSYISSQSYLALQRLSLNPPSRQDRRRFLSVSTQRFFVSSCSLH